MAHRDSKEGKDDITRIIEETVRKEDTKKTRSRTAASKKTAARSKKAKAKSVKKKTSTKTATKKTRAKKKTTTKKTTRTRKPGSKKTTTVTKTKRTKKEERVVSESEKALPETMPAESTIEGIEPRELNHTKEPDFIRARAAKFQIEEETRFVEPRYPKEIPEELPEEYGDTRLVLMVRDPEWIFAYWELAPEVRNEHGLPRGKHDRTMALRIHDVTGHEYSIDNPKETFYVEISDDTSSWYLRMPEGDRFWVAELGYYNEENYFVQLARSNYVRVPRNSVSPFEPEEWMEVVEEPMGVQGRVKTAPVVKRAPPPVAVTEKLPIEIPVGYAPGGSEYPASEYAARVRKERGFQLEVGTDIVLYGATEPGARVTINDAEIALNEDGTFTQRFALPDGVQHIRVEARKADGTEKRDVTVIVSRETQ